ncbi:MAG: trypsin-like peptidase domain-containing protein [Planctomycetes bacterium]|nr:trypsin-like peptidase domain-containing protein [Planctomycetota bacterium]
MAPLILAGAAFAVVAWLAWDRLGPQQVHTDATPRAIEPRGELADFEKATIRIYEENTPSVVFIVSRAQLGWQVSEGAGTGFVWDDRGYVVTNFHVVKDVVLAHQDRVSVRFQGLRELDAVIVGIEPTVDIAVVKILQPPDALRPIPLGTSKDLRVGQAVFAIGNPFGLTHTLTTGVVSALDRVIESPLDTPIQGVIQVDAAINPGNSGGPLLDSAGRLIGMNTAIVSPSGANAGIGFAVPVDTINRVVPRLIQGDPGRRPAMGFESSRYPITLANKQRHPVVSTVQPDTGAAEAGLRGTSGDRLGDILLSIDGVNVQSIEDVRAILDQHEVGDTVAVRVLRHQGGNSFEEVELKVPLKTELQRR